MSTLPTSAVSVHQAPNHSSGALLLPALLIVDSLHFVFARLLLPHISPDVSAMFVLGIATAQLAVYGIARGKLRWSMLRSNLLFFVIVGFCVAVSTNINYIAVRFIDAGTASMLGKLTALYAVGFGLFWLRERLTPVQIGGALLSIAGALIISFQPVEALRFGALLIVGSTFLYALHMAIVKRYGDALEFFNFFFFRLLLTAAFLLLFATARRALVWPSATAWGLLLLVATVDVLISRSLYYLALRRLNVSLLSVILTLSPVAAVLWSILLFGERPNAQQLLGGAVVLIGVGVVAGRRRRS